MKNGKRLAQNCAQLLILSGLLMSGTVHAEETDSSVQFDTMEVVETAEQQAKQALGSSTITKEDIENHPVSNDLSEIIRREPGVNLTGNSASGERGNNRQIDLRGMGPENTLILIDGRPVTSRNSVRYGWSEERDTRGDSNWVPAEMVDHIEILRGPAAARYGSGAMGGVVNIVTKKTSDELSGSVTVYQNAPENGDEGDTKRLNFNVTGPLGKSVSFRVYGSRSQTHGDSASINEEGVDTSTAGREGVNNEDINAIISWIINKSQTIEFGSGYSSQKNFYAGDTMHGSLLEEVDGTNLVGETTNKMWRRNIFLTHLGDWGWGKTRFDISYDYTNNTRLSEGLTGGVEGTINSDDTWNSTKFANTRVKGETNIPFTLGSVHQTMTVGVEFLNESLKDPGAFGANSVNPSVVKGYNPDDSEMDQDSYAVYVEDNIYAGHGVTITPGVRLDQHEVFGSNVSPSLNAQWEINNNWTIKGGVARAYKAPNLYQSNPNYIMNSRGNGCYKGNGVNDTGCYIQGSDDLEPEISINKEIGVALNSEPLDATLTYFRNDYDNKVYAGKTTKYLFNNGANRIYQWENAGEALIEGVEGSIFIPIVKSVDFRANITYMMESEMKRTGQPLSIIPKYTVNGFIDWKATEELTLGVNTTFYGKQESPTINLRTEAELTEDEQDEVDPYHIFGVSATYRIGKRATLSAGINNLFDKVLYRENEGAKNYNEPGRTYYTSMTLNF